jgi:hypothetical protein
MSEQIPVLRSCGYCRGTGDRNGYSCMACRGAGMVWVAVPDAGYPDADWLPPHWPGPEV